MLPSKKELVEYLKENGSNAFWWRWVKSVDAYIGPSGAIDFVYKFERKYYSNEVHQEFNELD